MELGQAAQAAAASTSHQNATLASFFGFTLRNTNAMLGT